MVCCFGTPIFIYIVTSVSHDAFIHPFVSRSAGEISTRLALDREHQSSYQLVVVVQDSGTPPRSATGTAFITVLDENDNAPFFTRRDLLIQVHGGLDIMEKLWCGSQCVMWVKVTSDDSVVLCVGKSFNKSTFSFIVPLHSEKKECIGQFRLFRCSGQICQLVA